MSIKLRLATLAACCAMLASGGIAMAAETTLQRVELTDSAAKCLDGTTPVIYYDANDARVTDPDTWVVVFEGTNECKTADGGECTTFFSYLQKCQANGNDYDGVDDGDDGVCDFFNATAPTRATIKKGGLFDPDGAVSAFATAIKVWVPSCTQDRWMGNGVMTCSPLAVCALAPKFARLYPQGALIVREVFDYLSNIGLDFGRAENEKLNSDSDKLLMVGESQGSNAVWTHLDDVCDDLASYGVTKCKGATFSFMPATHRARFDENSNETQDWSDFLTDRQTNKELIVFNHRPNCRRVYTDTVASEVTVDNADPWKIDLINSDGRQMCLTEYGRMASLTRPLFIGFHRGDGVGAYGDWTVGCTDANAQHGCINSAADRDTDIGVVLSDLPVGSGAVVGPNDGHLFIFKDVDLRSCDNNGSHAPCWDNLGTLQEIYLDVDYPGESFQKAVEGFWNDDPFYQRIYCHNELCE